MDPTTDTYGTEVDFRIVLVDGTTFAGGEHLSSDYGDFPGAQLEEYEHAGDWLCLRYSGGCELEIPEHRVAHIVTYPVSDAQ